MPTRPARGCCCCGPSTRPWPAWPEQAAADPYQGEVPDPYGGQPGDYALALDLVQAAVRGLTGRLAELLDVPATGAGGG